jgi:acetoin utilization protein AcuC
MLICEKGALPMPVAILYRDELKEYDFGPGHPFRGDRYELFPKFLNSRLAPDGFYRILPAEWAREDDLLSICDKDYIDFNREYYQAAYGGWISYYENFSRYQSLDNKPVGSPGKIEEAARLIVGQAKLACDLVQQGSYQKVISLGGGMHHAKRRLGEGFCIYNDVAFAAHYLVEKYHLERVLVLDTDAHAGNGTAEYLRSSAKTLFIDIHQDPRTIYPGTGFASDVGVEAGKGHIVNIPMPVYAGNDSYKLVFEQLILPLTREYQPQVIIRNGGSDPHFNDGLTYLGMTVGGFRMMGRLVTQMAEICGGRQIDLLASGYNRAVLPYAWLSLMAGIADFPIEVEEPEPIPPQYEIDGAIAETQEVIESVKQYQRDYWRCFR